MRSLLLLACLTAATAELIRFGYDSPVTIEIQPCGEPPKQPRRSLTQATGCPQKCLVRWKGATNDYGTGPVVVPVKKTHKSTIKFAVENSRPHYLKRGNEFYSGNGGSIQAFAWGSEGANGVSEITVTPPSIAFEGQPLEATVEYLWSKDGDKACEVDLEWKIVDEKSLGQG